MIKGLLALIFALAVISKATVLDDYVNMPDK